MLGSPAGGLLLLLGAVPERRVAQQHGVLGGGPLLRPRTARGLEPRQQHG